MSQDWIKPIGVHPHSWQIRARAGELMLMECTACGTRKADDGTPWHRGTAPKLPAPWQAWLEGGELRVQE